MPRKKKLKPLVVCAVSGCGEVSGGFVCASCYAYGAGKAGTRLPSAVYLALRVPVKPPLAPRTGRTAAYMHGEGRSHGYVQKWQLDPTR